MRSFVAFAALALSAADLASAGPCKPRPTTTADVTETSAGGADATTLPEPPTNVPIVNACEGGGMTDLSLFKTEGDVSSNRQEGFTKDGSPDTACAQLAAVSSGPLGKRETAGDVAALKQTLTGLNTRTKYTVQFYYRVFSSPSEATACTLEAYIGDVQFFNTDILANDASASYDQVLVSTSVDAAEGDLNIKTTCANGGSASVFVDSIFISNQVTPENIDNYRLDFGDGQIREPANLPATTAIPPTTEDGAATGTIAPEATTTAASGNGNGGGNGNGSNNSAASTSAIEGEATSNPTQGGDSQPTQEGSSPTTVVDGGSSEPTDAAGNGGDKSTQTQGSGSQPTEGSGSDSQTTTVAGGDSSQNTSAAEDQDSDSTSTQTQGSNSQSTSVSQSEGSETTEAASDATATSSSSESSQSTSVASSGSDLTSVFSGSDSTSAPVDAITTTTVAVSESTSAPADDITTITISVSESASVPADIITTTTAADSESTSAPAEATTTITADETTATISPDETTTTSPPSETTQAFVARAEPARTQCLNTANSVQNGDFEDSDDAGNHWAFTGTAQVVQNNEISSNAHTIGNNGVGFVGPDTGSFTQTVDNLEAGENYSLGVAYYIASGEGLADNQCTVKVTLAGDEVASFDPFADSDAWNNYRNKITQIAPSATEGVLSFELNCQGQPSAFTLMMDDIFLVRCNDQ